MTAPAFDLDDVIARAAARAQPADPALLAAFARAFLAGIERTDAAGEPGLALRVAEAFAFAAERAPGAVAVRVTSPAEPPGRTRIELLQDDRPFLVDTVRLVLRRLALRERVFLHPILGVRRDAAGRLLAVDADAPTRESLIHVEVSPQVTDPARLAEIEGRLRDAMQQVRQVTEDFAPMVEVVRGLEVRVERAGPWLAPAGPERARRVRKFLAWLVDGHFLFLGVRRYALRPLPEAGFEVQLLPGSGLGLFRDDADSRLREPRRGDAIPDELRDILDDPRILVVGKSRVEAPIHRAGRLDRLAVTEHDEAGRPCGLVMLFGLFTAQALRTPGSKVPLLSSRLEQILRDEGVEGRSHRHRALFDAFDSVPIEVLLGTDADGVAALLREIVEAEGSEATRLVLRADRRGRSVYAAVVLPRERYSETLRARLRALLVARTGATWVDDRASFIEEGTAVVHLFCTSSAEALARPDPAALEAEVRALTARWEDRFFDALVARFGEGEGAALAARYEDAFPPELRVATPPEDAVRDVEALEALAAGGGPRFALFFPHDEPAPPEAATLRIFLPEPRLLSDLLPVVDGFGIRVIDAQQVTVEPAGRAPVAVHTLRVLPLGADQADLDAVAPRLGDALGAVLCGDVASDPLNGLVLGAGLDWRQVDVVRAQLECFLQVQGALTRPFVRAVLLENPLAVRTLVQLFAARLDPAVPEAERAGREARLRAAFEGYRDRIPSLNEDRALAGLLSIAEATLRTNAFAAPRGPHVLAFKLDPAKVSEIAPPRPYREIFVHSTELLGVHLRGGPVARGGLRWSDRADDLRVEILGLMRTQMLKNGLIVPVGAKGGFVLRRGGLSPREARARADEQYRVFVGQLLALTDDLDAAGAAVPPPGLVRRDGDDPYLVVAADKGTAHLSDTANEIAAARGFWLGDGFASGGSNGYDHKRYGITARGAWECARHHFAELGIDPERDPYTAVGIGDMSGDVFGNGLLLMRRVKLLGAFDHRHVFLDPDPDPAAAWAERKRLFETPGSTWADYDPRRISPGGGVFERGAKSIELAPAVRERLGLGPGRVSSPDLVRALLALDVDLLWNGGIGTYVKASHESHADVGDRANDAVRIDATALRARVVAEGGNLGLTQAARVEAALHARPEGTAVRLETDSVDNSAGVDLSDHEVNYKILLAPLVRAGRLGADERHRAIHAAADDACASVLAHNRGQALALSLDELRARRAPGAFLRAIEDLCEAAELDPAGLRLPDARALAARAASGRGLVRPELAVLLGVAKLVVRRSLAESPWAAAPALEPLLQAYFPPAFRREWPAAIGEHPLRREITALVATNRLVDAGGVTLVPGLAAELGLPLADAAAAALLAEEVLDAPARRDALLALGRPTPRVTVYGALLELDRGVRAAARYLARSGALALDAARVERLRAGLAVLQEEAPQLLTPGELEEAAGRRAALVGDGLPPALAAAVAAALLADRALNVLRVCEGANVSPLEAGRVVARIGEASGILWLHQRLREIDAGDPWDRMALADLRWELLDLQRALAEAVLRARPAEPVAAVDAFLARHAPLLAGIRDLQRDAGASPPPSALVVIASRLRALRPAG